VERGGKDAMMTVNVLLSGRLYLQGYGRGKKAHAPGWFELRMADGGTVEQAIQTMEVPAEEVAVTMLNSRRCERGASLKAGDRLILIPADVAALWRALGVMNMGMESVCDF